MAKYYHGQWKIACDICGWRFPSSEIRKRWDGQLTCAADFEHDHPQKYIRAITDPKPVPSDMIRRWQDSFIQQVCTAYTSQAISGIAVAGCAIAGKNNNLPPAIYGSPG